MGANSGACGDWSRFSRVSLSPPLPYYVSSVTAQYAAYSLDNMKYVTNQTTTTCSDVTVVQSLVAALASPGANVDLTCNNHVFRVRAPATAAGQALLCVDCPSTIAVPAAPHRCPWVPCKNPLPHIPPDPSAILLWMML